MTDIPALLELLRFRRLDKRNCDQEACETLMGVAADEIDRLTAENERLRARPRHWHCDTHGDFDAYVEVGCPHCMSECRKTSEVFLAALRRLGSMEAFTMPGSVAPLTDGELMARIEYAASFRKPAIPFDAKDTDPVPPTPRTG